MIPAQLHGAVGSEGHGAKRTGGNGARGPQDKPIPIEGNGPESRRGRTTPGECPRGQWDRGTGPCGRGEGAWAGVRALVTR